MARRVVRSATAAPVAEVVSAGEVETSEAAIVAARKAPAGPDAIWSAAAAGAGEDDAPMGPMVYDPAADLAARHPGLLPDEIAAVIRGRPRSFAIPEERYREFGKALEFARPAIRAHRPGLSEATYRMAEYAALCNGLWALVREESARAESLPDRSVGRTAHVVTPCDVRDAKGRRHNSCGALVLPYDATDRRCTACGRRYDRMASPDGALVPVVRLSTATESDDADARVASEVAGILPTLTRKEAEQLRRIVVADAMAVHSATEAAAMRLLADAAEGKFSPEDAAEAEQTAGLADDAAARWLAEAGRARAAITAPGLRTR